MRTEKDRRRPRLSLGIQRQLVHPGMHRRAPLGHLKRGVGKGLVYPSMHPPHHYHHHHHSQQAQQRPCSRPCPYLRLRPASSALRADAYRQEHL